MEPSLIIVLSEAFSHYIKMSETFSPPKTCSWQINDANIALSIRILLRICKEQKINENYQLSRYNLYFSD